MAARTARLAAAAALAGLLACATPAASQTSAAIAYACGKWPASFPYGCTAEAWSALPYWQQQESLAGGPPAAAVIVAPAPLPATSCAPVGELAVTRIAALGDSITKGGETYHPWVAYLSSHRPSLSYVDNHGVGGDTTTQMRARVSQALAGGVQALFVMGGRNDVVYGVSVATTLENLRAIFAEARAVGVEPILVGVTPDITAGPGLIALRAALRTLAVEQGVRYIDPWPRLADPDRPGAMRSLYIQEGAHPNDRGGALIARVVAEALGWIR